MNNLLTKKVKKISLEILEVQSLIQESSMLLQKQWLALKKVQELLGGDDEEKQFTLFE